MAVRLLNQYDREVNEQVRVSVLELADTGLIVSAEEVDFKVESTLLVDIYVKPYNDFQERGYFARDVVFAGTGQIYFYKETQERVDWTELEILKLEDLGNGYFFIDNFRGTTIAIYNTTGVTIEVTKANGDLIREIAQEERWMTNEKYFKIKRQS